MAFRSPWLLRFILLLFLLLPLLVLVVVLVIIIRSGKGVVEPIDWSVTGDSLERTGNKRETRVTAIPFLCLLVSRERGTEAG